MTPEERATMLVDECGGETLLRNAREAIAAAIRAAIDELTGAPLTEETIRQLSEATRRSAAKRKPTVAGWTTLEGLFIETIEQAVAEERAACLALCESEVDGEVTYECQAGRRIAIAIRARGQQS